MGISSIFLYIASEGVLGYYDSRITYNGHPFGRPINLSNKLLSSDLHIRKAII